jgi:hypothetical protein
MRLFRRKSSERKLVPCPRCDQLLAADALECDMCGFDLRESSPGPLGRTAPDGQELEESPAHRRPPA